MNNKCDVSELKHQLLQKFYELAKEPEKWGEHFINNARCLKRIDSDLVVGSQYGKFFLLIQDSGDKRTLIAKSDFKTVEVEPTRTEYATRSWFGFESKTKIPIRTIPAVTKQIPDDFHQTCASLFAAWEDAAECSRLNEALQSLSPAKPKVSKQSPVKVAATPVKAPRPPRKAPLASAPATKSRSTGSSKK